ncbi:stress-response A/B barrel domain-containing protein UP3-like isoform X2 [Chenopodium quinoa]|uniref:stress-response A/B barrel domain-containing protein UP3-like isoform X2 n=1 Tax=Chenopodium quinoa TaxID=63459 RepID=UPI000B78033D|nr:stress-response A/B barrel domain-containing protein UP3-like isoform X2 [Chenopodium quinoa]
MAVYSPLVNLQAHNLHCYSSFALAMPCLSLPYFSLNSYSLEMKCWGGRRKSGVCLASSSQNSSNDVVRKRKVVEHLCLLRAKEELSDEQEKDMLDNLYTSQYHMAGIVAISLGRTSDQNSENYSHGVFMRFQRKEDLAKFYENPLYLRVLKEHVTPFCHDLLYVDFEAEVEDDILAIFRKGEEFNSGVEFVILIKFHESALDGPAEDVLTSLANLAFEFPSLIVQSTQGSNFNSESKDYTHAIVIRFRSVEAQRIFMESSEYKHLWESKLLPISQNTLSFHFLVDPVGTELM